METAQTKAGVFKVNFLIFLAYYILAVILGMLTSGDSGLSGFVLFFGYMIHAGILILISIGEGLRGFSQKVKTLASSYFLCAVLLLIVGFGACTFAVTSNIFRLDL